MRVAVDRGLFRIRGKSKQVRTQSVEVATAQDVDPWLTRLTKLIPAEVVGVYLTGKLIATENHALPVWAALCLVLVIVVRAALTRDPMRGFSAKSIQWSAVAVSAVSFVIWVYAMGDHLPYLDLGRHGFWASLVALAWPLLGAIFIKGSD